MLNNKGVYARREPFNRSVAFLLYQVSPLGAVSYGVEIIMKEESIEEVGMRHEPTFELPDESAQELMDELWTCGFRPSEGTGSAGALSATQKHLEDMRRLVFNKVGDQP